jgi:lipopolysaccharide transport system ATP-binding protein
MYVRLAFAVAAHLEPEILIVDEVLAVGDAQFQKKCLGKMSEVARDGRTILFVSHNTAAIDNFCSKCILLEKGEMIFQGKTQEVIDRYIKRNAVSDDSFVDLSKSIKRSGTTSESTFLWKSICILNSKNQESTSIMLGEPFKLVLQAEALDNISDVQVGFSIATLAGVFVSNTYQTDYKISQSHKKGLITYTISFPENILSPDNYSIDLSAKGQGIYDWIPEAISFQVLDFASEDQKNVIPWGPHHGGCVRYPCIWKVSDES